MSEPLLHDEPEQGSAFTEAILDNLSGWTVVALVIGLLFVFANLVKILDRYIGGLPAVGP